MPDATSQVRLVNRPLNAFARYGANVNSVVREAIDDPPAQTVYLPGSIAYFPSAFHTASCCCGTPKTAELVSPEADCLERKQSPLPHSHTEN